MSEPSIPISASGLEELLISCYLDVATCTLVVFDYIINLDRDLLTVRGLRRSKVYASLYACLRYFGLIYAIWPIFPRLGIVSYQFCYASIVLQQIMLRILLGFALDGKFSEA